MPNSDIFLDEELIARLKTDLVALESKFHIDKGFTSSPIELLLQSACDDLLLAAFWLEESHFFSAKKNKIFSSPESFVVDRTFDSDCQRYVHTIRSPNIDELGNQRIFKRNPPSHIAFDPRFAEELRQIVELILGRIRGFQSSLDFMSGSAKCRTTTPKSSTKAEYSKEVTNYFRRIRRNPRD